MVSIRNITRRLLPHLPYQDIARAILGRKYDLSLVLCASTLSRRLSRERRGKDKPGNVISFPLGEASGEIFLDLALIKREAKEQGIECDDYTLFLFIHGCLHLAGMEHGATMERREQNLVRRFG